MSTLVYAIELAQKAYQVYGQTTNFKNYQGLPMPDWKDLPDNIREAWVSTVAYLVGQIEHPGVHWMNAFDERQIKEISFCKLYSDDFAHGTDGHNAKMIIASMARLLDANNAQALPHKE